MSAGYGFSHSSAPVKTVKEIQFGILSPEEIVRPFYLFPLSPFPLALALARDVCSSRIPSPALLNHPLPLDPTPLALLSSRSTSPLARADTLQKAYSVATIEYPEVMDEATQKQKKGGLMDPKMGTIDRNFKCESCGEGMQDCPGHFGHIELARPVFHIGSFALSSAA
jgi:hypothetical protein